jgi:hypothetical protein
LKEFIDEDQIPAYIGGGCSCCQSGSIADQIDRIYQRNCKWREERLAAATEKAGAAGAAPADAKAPE